MQEKDTYYDDQTKLAIDKAIERTKGKTLDEIRAEIHRSYPFGPLRQGKAYKIWNKAVLAKEAEIGIDPRKHQNKAPHPVEEESRRIINKIVAESPDVPPQELAYRIRKACPYKDKSSRSFKIWCRVMSEIKSELGLGGGL